MVASAVKLLAKSGYQGASFSEVLSESKAPRGSIYHHFPGGKDQLIQVALETHWRGVSARLRATEPSSTAQVVAGFVEGWRALLTRSDFRLGCSLAGVTVTAGEPKLLDTAGSIFTDWSSLLAEQFASVGVDPTSAEDHAVLLLSACEGAVVLARASRSLDPLDRVERTLLAAIG